MQTGLQEEKRATQRQWAKREKQIEQVISNTAGMYGRATSSDRDCLISPR